MENDQMSENDIKENISDEEMAEMFRSLPAGLRAALALLIAEMARGNDVQSEDL